MNLRSTEELIVAFRAGQESAGDALFRRFEPWIRLMAQGQVESRFRAKFDAADLVQQTLLEAARAFPQFRGTAQAELLAWLRQILARVLAHEIRRYRGTQKRNLDLEVSLDQELGRSSARLGDWLAASATSAAERLDRQERELVLARILARLPEDYRTVLVLRQLEGLSLEEVACRMRRSPGATRMLWVRALARLRAQVEEDGELSGH